jgi:phosphonate transport system substrate-binding protein
MFTISPDFPPNLLAGWYIFNTWFQKQTGLNIHLNLYHSFEEQQIAIDNNKNDIVYVNPFDAVRLVRDKGFVPIAKVEGRLDEAVIVVKAESPLETMEAFEPNLKLAMTENPDVNMISMMLLEAVDLNNGNIQKTTYDSYIIMVKNLLKGEVEAGIFLEKAYDELSAGVKKQLKIVLRSDLEELYHSFLIGPELADRQAEIQSLLVSMGDNPIGKGVLGALGFKSWCKIENEEMEFMIDLIDTLSAENL